MVLFVVCAENNGFGEFRNAAHAQDFVNRFAACGYGSSVFIGAAFHGSKHTVALVGIFERVKVAYVGSVTEVIYFIILDIASVENIELGFVGLNGDGEVGTA